MNIKNAIEEVDAGNLCLESQIELGEMFISLKLWEAIIRKNVSTGDDALIKIAIAASASSSTITKGIWLEIAPMLSHQMIGIQLKDWAHGRPSKESFVSAAMNSIMYCLLSSKQAEKIGNAIDHEIGWLYIFRLKLLVPAQYRNVMRKHTNPLIWSGAIACADFDKSDVNEVFEEAWILNADNASKDAHNVYDSNFKDVYVELLKTQKLSHNRIEKVCLQILDIEVIQQALTNTDMLSTEKMYNIFKAYVTKYIHDGTRGSHKARRRDYVLCRHTLQLYPFNPDQLVHLASRCKTSKGKQMFLNAIHDDSSHDGFLKGLWFRLCSCI